VVLERLKKQIEEARGVSHIPFWRTSGCLPGPDGRHIAGPEILGPDQQGHRGPWRLVCRWWGDTGSFNSIPDFQDGVHGVVAKDAESMIQAVTG